MKQIPLNVNHSTMKPSVNTYIYVHKNTIKRYCVRPQKKNRHIIVIGGGPVGIRFASELLERLPTARITVFGNEPYTPYNRVKLSSLLAGDIAYEDIITALPNKNAYPNFTYIVKTIRNIDTTQQTVIDIDGKHTIYSKLVIATGSRPHIPNIEGIKQSGVYTFRNLKDTEFLYARRARSRHTVILGGGLLGLEAARALAQLNTQVTVIQQGDMLMNRQLDSHASALLQQDVEALNIRIIIQSGIGEIIGQNNRVNAVKTRQGDIIACDTVVICAGIKTNLEIARNAKIKIGKGIIVNNKLKTSAQDVYAIGECCEHNGSVYGLVTPGFEQAAILADVLSGGDAEYLGSLEVSRLKVVGANVCSMGNTDERLKRPFFRHIQYHNNQEKIYRKITFKRGRITGVVAYGEWNETRRIQEAYRQQRYIWPWQQLRFKLTGYLWGKEYAQDPKQWTPSTIICQCNNISQGTLTNAIESGCSTPSMLMQKTNAGTVCGSCKPLLEQLTGIEATESKEPIWQFAFLASLAALVIAFLIVLLPEMQVSSSVQTQTLFEKIWNDKYWKQVTGFSLLGLTVVGLFMSFQKRMKIRKLGIFSYWRLLHVFLGLLCISVLILHTGLHLGANLNQLLMWDFLAITTLGALSGIVISISHKLSTSTNREIRRSLTWLHILAAWPLPILVSLHILTVYYF